MDKMQSRNDGIVMTETRPKRDSDNPKRTATGILPPFKPNRGGDDGCGGGCLLKFIAIIVGAIILFSYFARH